MQGSLHLSGYLGSSGGTSRRKKKRKGPLLKLAQSLRWKLYLAKEWSDQARQAAEEARKAHAKHASAAESWRDWATRHGASEAAKHYERARGHFAAGNVESGHRAMRFGHSGLGRVMPQVIRSVMKL